MVTQIQFRTMKTTIVPILDEEIRIVEREMKKEFELRHEGEIDSFPSSASEKEFSLVTQYRPPLSRIFPKNLNIHH